MSLASGVYGTRRRDTARGQTRKLTARSSGPKIVDRNVACVAGRQWSEKHPVGCDCSCHYDENAECDMAFGRGNRCDGKGQA